MIAQHNNKEYFYQNDFHTSSFINFGARLTITLKLVILPLVILVYLFFQIMMFIHLILINPIEQPDATDLYGYGSGNPNLQPEESFSYEFGVKRLM